MANTKKIDFDGPLPDNCYYREKPHSCGRHWFYKSNDQCPYCMIKWGADYRARKRKANPPKKPVVRNRGEKNEQRRIGAAQRSALALFGKPLKESP